MPVRQNVDVLSVERHRGRFRVRTDDGEWVARQVVVATGDCGVPYRPPAARGCSAGARADRRSPVPRAGTARRRWRYWSSARGRAVFRSPPSYDGPVATSSSQWAGTHAACAATAVGTSTTGSAPRRSGAFGRRGAGRSAAHTRLRAQRPERRRAARPGDRLGARRHACRPPHGLQGVCPRASTTASSRPSRTPTIGCSRCSRRIDAHIAESSDAAQIPPAEQVARVRADEGPRVLDLRARGVSTIVWATGYQPRVPVVAHPGLRCAGRDRSPSRRHAQFPACSCSG